MPELLSLLFALVTVGDTPAANIATTAPEKLICRHEAQIGSLVCRTEADWKAVALESKEISNGLQRRAGEVRNP